MKKKCFKCKEIKEHIEFYKNKNMGDGLLGKCKLCTNIDTKKRANELSKDPNWCEKEKARQRDKYYRLGYKDKHKPTPEYSKERTNKYRNKYPEKYAAISFSQHIKTEKGIEKHHWSYIIENAKDVIMLNKKDHAKAHTFLKYKQKEMIYYTLTGEALDTRDKHENYISHVLNLPY